MPLQSLPAAITRVKLASSSTSTVHPLHAILGPIVMTARAVSSKYNTELPAILTAGGGAGEIEEAMMWYSLNHERIDPSVNGGDESLGPWLDEKWKREWINRMERREYVFF